MAGSQNGKMVEVAGLTRRLGRDLILRGVEFDLSEGECLALFGPSGCGKTTLLRLLAGLDQPDDGTIRLAGTLASGPHRHLRPHQRGIAMVFQDLALWPHLTALDQVEFAIPRSVRGRRARRDRARELLNGVHLHRHLDKHPHALSGGEQQRVAIARALAQDPRVLLLDEPFSSLDAGLKTAMLKLVRRIHSDRRLTTIYVTHLASDIAGFADRVARMKDGRIAGILSLSEFLHSPEVSP